MDEWKVTAKRFRAQEWEWCKTVDEWVSAMINGHVAVGGRDGHAICHCGLVWNNGSVLSTYCNSWGNWGQTLETNLGPLRSFGFDSERKIATMVRYDGWILRAVQDPSLAA
jgi:hypothetical protein